MKTAGDIAIYRPFLPCEVAWVRKHHSYSSLLVSDHGRLLSGLLRFKANYPDYKKESLVLEGEYQVEVRIGLDSIPYVWEVGGYLQNRADEMGRPLIDMHVYPRGKHICMGTLISMRRIIRQHESLPKKFIEGVFDNLIVPYFYYHTYWKKYGREPWPGLAHDKWGFCQDYLNNRDIEVLSYLNQCPPEVALLVILQGKIHANDECPCGCGKAKRCHCGAVKGFNALRKDYFSLSNAQKIAFLESQIQQK